MRRAVPLFALLFLALPAHAAKVTVGTATGGAGSDVTVPLVFAGQGAAVSTFSVDLSFPDPLTFAGIETSFYATAAGKTAIVAPLSGGGLRVALVGSTPMLVPDGTTATLTLHVAATAVVGTYAIGASNPQASDVNNAVVSIVAVPGAVTVASGAPAGLWVVPSAAHLGGANGAAWTTDLLLANTGAADALLTLRFLGHDADGTQGPQYSLALPKGRTTVVPDVLGTFGVGSGYGALQVTSTTASLAVSAQTWTPGASCNGAAPGTYGQSVPAVPVASLITTGAPRSITGIREDASFRTNLVLANGGVAACDVDVVLVLASGIPAATKRFTLPPLGMTQATSVVRVLGVNGDVTGARLVVAPVTAGGTVAAYASAIDNASNDPRTLLPQ